MVTSPKVRFLKLFFLWREKSYIQLEFINSLARY